MFTGTSGFYQAGEGGGPTGKGDLEASALPSSVMAVAEAKTFASRSAPGTDWISRNFSNDKIARILGYDGLSTMARSRSDAGAAIFAYNKRGPIHNVTSGRDPLLARFRHFVPGYISFSPSGTKPALSYVDAHARLRGSFPLVRVPRRRTKNFVATSFGERLCAS